MLDKDNILQHVEELQDLVKNADSHVAMVKALLPVATMVIDKYKPLAVQVIKVLFRKLIDVREEMKPESATLSVMRAEWAYRNFSSYQKSGFTRKEAFALVLASIKSSDLSGTFSDTARGFSSISRK